MEDAVTKLESLAEGNSSVVPERMGPSIEDRLDEIRALLERMLVLAETSAGEGPPIPDREALQAELERLRLKIDEIADQME